MRKTITCARSLMMSFLAIALFMAGPSTAEAHRRYIPLHARGGASSQVLTLLGDGDDVAAVLHVGRYWDKVQMASGKVGWVRKTQVDKLDLPDEAGNGGSSTVSGAGGGLSNGEARVTRGGRSCPLRVDCSRSTDEMTCLACNANREARGEGMRGMIEVNRTVLSRVSSRQWPNNICSVVYQRMQFEWTRRRTTFCTNRRSWENAKEASRQALREGSNGFDHFYASRTRPSWARRCRVKERIGKHTFCRITGVGVGALAREIPRHSGGSGGSQSGSPTVR